jgi:hypothetical protein
LKGPLLTRCLNVDVNLLGTATSKYATSKRVEANQYHDDKDREYGDNTYAAPTITFFSHSSLPGLLRLLKGGWKIGGVSQLLTQRRMMVNASLKKKGDKSVILVSL